MKFRFLSIVLLIAFILPSVSSAAAFQYSGWIAYWKKDDGVAQAALHLSQLSTITPFAYSVTPDGTLSDTMKIGEAPWPDLLAQARAQNKKIIPSVMWANADAIYDVLSKPASRQAHEKGIVSMVNDNNFDGVEIDYENKKVATKASFSKFLTELSASLHQSKKTLVCTVESRIPPSSRFVVVPKDIEYVNDYVILNKVCDEVRIMAYDQGNIDIKLNAAKGKTQPYMPVADAEWVEKVIKETVKTIKPSKLVLGIPTYGREYELTQVNGVYKYKQIRSISFKDAMASAATAGVTPIRNNAGELSIQFTSGTTTHFISLTDTIAINSKIGLAKKYGLKGAAIFKFDADGDLGLWQTLR